MKISQTITELTSSDEKLVRDCCKGDPAAWSALIEKYKNLIFSIPIRFGLSRDDAADVFQAVCVELLTGLPRLREPKALPKWLMQTSYHQCLRWKRNTLNLLDDTQEIENQPAADSEDFPGEWLYQIQREQGVREAMTALPPRCRQLVSMLFFETPALPYQQVAAKLGIATGSIGFIRGRCLKKMRQLLEDRGFE